MNRLENLTAPLAVFAAGVRFEDLPKDVVQQTTRFVLDAIGCAIGAMKEDRRKAALAIAVVRDFGATGKASIIGGGMSHPCIAAFGNGFLINATDNDDTHKRALAHLGSVVVPAALATIEEIEGNGKDLITAIVAGYEVAARIGMAVMPTHYRFWHSTATNGTFGAAVAAARGLGLSADQMVMTFGFAGTQAAGLNTFFESGDDSKSVHPGKAGLNGVMAARMAMLGVTSPPNILGHPKGYLAAYSLDPKPLRLTEGLGETFEILQNGFKFFPSILASHSPIAATLEITSTHKVDPAQVASVTVRTYATVKSHFSSKKVDTVMAARLSVPYCVAIALVDREATQRQFQKDRFDDALVRSVLDKVDIVVGDELTPLYPEKFPAQVSVTMMDGSVYSAEEYYPKGDPSNPLSDDEIRAKFLQNAEGVVKDPRRIIEIVENLSVQENLNELGALLRGPGLHPLSETGDENV